MIVNFFYFLNSVLQKNLNFPLILKTRVIYVFKFNGLNNMHGLHIPYKKKVHYAHIAFYFQIIKLVTQVMNTWVFWFQKFLIGGKMLNKSLIPIKVKTIINYANKKQIIFLQLLPKNKKCN